LKRLLLFCIFLTALLKAEVSVIDETKVDLYYANGIMLQDSEAKSQIKWEEQVDDLLFQYPQLQAKLGKTDVSYNISNGMVADMWEAFMQKVDLEPVYAGNWKAFKLLVSSMGIPGKASSFIIEANESASDMLQHDDTLDGQVLKYKESIQSGHSVVVVAHSQGNLFTYEAYRKLDNWMQDYFKAVSVASPRHLQIKLGTPHIAFAN